MMRRINSYALLSNSPSTYLQVVPFFSSICVRQNQIESGKACQFLLDSKLAQSEAEREHIEILLRFDVTNDVIRAHPPTEDKLGFGGDSPKRTLRLIILHYYIDPDGKQVVKK